jgi:hypothetical protein
MEVTELELAGLLRLPLQHLLLEEPQTGTVLLHRLRLPRLPRLHLVPPQVLEPEAVTCPLFLLTHQVDLVLPSKDTFRLFLSLSRFVDPELLNRDIFRLFLRIRRPVRVPPSKDT